VEPDTRTVAGVEPRRLEPSQPATAQRAPRPLAELLWALGAAALALLVACLVLEVWNADLRVPFDYSGDAAFTAAVVKNVVEEGALWENDELGAPRGQELYDFPVWAGDNVQLAIVRAIGLVVRDPIVAFNLFYLLTFPLAALTAFLVLRRLGVGQPGAFAASVLYALLPYHFLRGEDHLFLGAYWAVPLGCFLVLSVLSDTPLVTPLRSGRTLAILAACVVVGSAAVYYAAFTLVLLVFAAVLAAVARWSVRPLVTAGVLGAAIVGALVVNFAPAIVDRLREGSNPAIERFAFETEVFSLRPLQLVLPVRDHRIEALADIKERYENQVGVTEASFATLGVVGSVGLVVLLATLLLAVVRNGAPRGDPLLRYAAVSALVALFFAMTGGLAPVVSFLISPQLHAWNRLSVFIAFFALLAVALLVERLRGQVAWAMAAALVVVGALDQTTGAMTPRYAEAESEWRSDGTWVEQVDAALPEEAAVLQLPYVPFPSSPPVGRMVDYDEVRPYLHSDDLRWSYGAMKGRPEDVGKDVTPAGAEGEGFAGVAVDRFGYPDNGAAVEAELRRLSGREPIVSPNGRLAFYRL
jgi:phosphoglycerol transferase